MSKVTYINFGLNLSKQQLEKVIKAAENGESATIRLKKENLDGTQMLPLTKTQINRINKSKGGLDLCLSVAQLKHWEKTGGILPLAILLAGLGAAGGIAGGVSSAVSAANSNRAARDAQAEMIRHNKEVEAQMKSGSGIISDLAGKIPVFRKTLQCETFLGDLILGEHKVTSSHVAVDEHDLVNKKYIDRLTTEQIASLGISSKLDKSGGIITGNVDLGVHKIMSSYVAVHPNDLTNKEYVDSGLAHRLGDDDMKIIENNLSLKLNKSDKRYVRNSVGYVPCLDKDLASQGLP